jgi:hypothetical protein
MSSISEHYSLPAQSKAQRPRTRRGHPSPRPHPRSQVAALPNSGLTPIMGPANHAPGVPIMGMASSGPYLMGGADAGPRVSVMGSGDRGQRVDAFGDSDLRFVDSLFTQSRTPADADGADTRRGQGRT